MKRSIVILFVLLSSLLLVVSGPASAQQLPPIPEGYSTFSAFLTGPAEVPGPGDADGLGFSLVALSGEQGQVCVFTVVSNIGLPATAAHIHTGVAGVAGDVVVPLPTPNASGVATGCTAADSALISAIQSDPAAYYVNVHNAEFPSGAVRGQLSPLNLS